MKKIYLIGSIGIVIMLMIGGYLMNTQNNIASILPTSDIHESATGTPEPPIVTPPDTKGEMAAPTIHSETITTGSGIKVTITSNGPTSRAMTPEELESFQKKIRDNKKTKQIKITQKY